MNDEEWRLLRLHIGQGPKTSVHLMAKERTQRLNAALDAMADGLSQEQLDAMTAAMTEDYIEPWDESLWLGLDSRDGGRRTDSS